MNKNMIFGIFVGLTPLCLWADNSNQQSEPQVQIDTLNVELSPNNKQAIYHSKNVVLKTIIKSIRPIDNKLMQKKRKRILQKLEKQSLDTTLTAEERMAILLKDF